MNSSSFTEWKKLTEKEREFFVGENYLPLHQNIAERIGLLKGSPARELSKELLRGSPIKDQSSPCCELSIVTNDAWGDEKETSRIRQWLYDLGIPFSKQVHLIYDHGKIVRTDWKIFVKYWDAFSWSVGLAMLVVDSSKQWVLEVNHEDVINYYAKGNKHITNAST